jgi:hypothetical protein
MVKHILELETHAHNPRLGSLVARILFQPVEEMSRVYFSRTLASIGAEDETQMSSVTGSTGKHAEKQAQADRASLCGTAQVLSSIVAAQTGASFILCSFGRPFLPLVLRFGLPQRYLATSAPELLQAWIWYIPILAINGVMEAFVSSVATPHDIHRQSRYDILAFTLQNWAHIRLPQMDGRVFCDIRRGHRHILQAGPGGRLPHLL